MKNKVKYEKANREKIKPQLKSKFMWLKRHCNDCNLVFYREKLQRKQSRMGTFFICPICGNTIYRYWREEYKIKNDTKARASFKRN